MKQKFEEICFKLDLLTVRERVILLLLGIVGLSMAWLPGVWDPMGAEQIALEKKITGLEGSLVTLGAEKRLIKARHEQDPDADNRNAKERLTADIDRLDQEIEKRTGNLIPPEKMVSVLEEWLGGRTDLELTRMEILPAEAISKGENGPARGKQLYKHGITMELRGTYLSTLKHLRSLESLKWHFVWDNLSYEVVGWPEANITLEVHTISTEDKWVEL